MRFLALGALALCPAPFAAAQEDEFIHPELEWKTIETQHFFVHYHDGAERTGRTIAKIAEEVYGPITSFYGHEPDQKVNFVVTDHDDISNGGAYFFENKIEIFAPSLDYVLRGTHNWLRDVVIPRVHPHCADPNGHEVRPEAPVLLFPMAGIRIGTPAGCAVRISRRHRFVPVVGICGARLVCGRRCPVQPEGAPVMISGTRTGT